jgi:hypothetical protein
VTVDTRPVDPRVIQTWKQAITTVSDSDLQAYMAPHPRLIAGFRKGKINTAVALTWVQVLLDVSGNSINRLVVCDATRLPNEVEWECAARAGSKGQWNFGDGELQLGTYSWFSANSDGLTQPTGQQNPASSAFMTCMAMSEMGGQYTGRDDYMDAPPAVQ